MMPKRLLLLIVICCCYFGHAQQKLRGSVSTDIPNISELLVVNLSKEIETRIDLSGKFVILAEVGDLLIIDASHIYRKKLLVDENDFSKEIKIEIEVKPVEIEAVEINKYSWINSESLGLVPKGFKRLTTQERRLYTATSTGVDALINGITGRTRMLKNLIKMEREDKKFDHLIYLFEDGFYTEILQIPEDKVNEFIYFSIYEIEKNLSPTQKTTYIFKLSKSRTELLLIQLAKKFLSEKE